ncbi:hypothetical protein LTR10_014880 [Elasticomyces elasticus]|nr:hypothetical protein LTR10_014880 [Elasticomyces elasticus]KAK5025724.1 hypothetical protein LTS07_007928 [Exophiala sideris]KAK5180615.1 hypothetical protein LTR44_006929 [Eurotiomycetes sp. CCFEE 6388]
MWREAFDDSGDIDGVENVDQHIISDETNGENSDYDLRVVKAIRKRSLSPFSDDSDIFPRRSRIRASPARNVVSRTAARVLHRSPQGRDGPIATQSEDMALARALKASQKSYRAEQNVAQEKARGVVSGIAGDRREEMEPQWALRISDLEYKANTETNDSQKNSGEGPRVLQP